MRFDDRCIVVPDKFPKARLHGLVIARDLRLQGPLDLEGPEDAALVRHMKAMGTAWAAQQAPGVAIRMGLHSVPSMRQLHLHVISQDFDSPCLKTKKHWNSFTTPFFLDVDWVMEQLEHGSGGGKARLEYSLSEKEALLKGPLRCHKCGVELSNMPKLKEHIRKCTKMIIM